MVISKKLNHKDLIEKQIEFKSNLHLNLMLGEQSKNLFRLQDFLNVDLNIFGNIVYVYGNKEKVKKTVILLNKVYKSILNSDGKNEYYELSDFLIRDIPAFLKHNLPLKQPLKRIGFP